MFDVSETFLHIFKFCFFPNVLTEKKLAQGAYINYYFTQKPCIEADLIQRLCACLNGEDISIESSNSAQFSSVALKLFDQRTRLLKVDEFISIYSATTSCRQLAKSCTDVKEKNQDTFSPLKQTIVMHERFCVKTV